MKYGEDVEIQIRADLHLKEGNIVPDGYSLCSLGTFIKVQNSNKRLGLCLCEIFHGPDAYSMKEARY